jgi:hypothetical protein
MVVVSFGCLTQLKKSKKIWKRGVTNCDWLGSYQVLTYTHLCVNYNFDRNDSKISFNSMMEKNECLKVLCFVDWKGDVCVKESSADI